MPQPVDLQVELARVTAADRVQQVADRLSLAAQQRMAAEAEQDGINHETQVQQTEQSQSEGVDVESHRQNPYVGRRRKRRLTDEDPEPAAKDETLAAADMPVVPEVESEGSRLDISV